MKSWSKWRCDQGSVRLSKFFSMSTLREQLYARQPHYQLAQVLPWATPEGAFANHYSEKGRLAKPERLMFGCCCSSNCITSAMNPSSRSGCRTRTSSFLRVRGLPMGAALRSE